MSLWRGSNWIIQVLKLLAVFSVVSHLNVLFNHSNRFYLRLLHVDCEPFKVRFVSIIEDYDCLNPTKRVLNQIFERTLEGKTSTFLINLANHSLHLICKWLEMWVQEDQCPISLIFANFAIQVLFDVERHPSIRHYDFLNRVKRGNVVFISTKLLHIEVQSQLLEMVIAIQVVKSSCKGWKHS